MKILITGGSGFIGSHLVEKFSGKGHEVGVVDTAKLPSDLKVESKKIKFWNQDINDETGMNAVFSEFTPEVVCHLAAQIDVSDSMKTPGLYEETNVLATLKLLELGKSFSVKKLVFASTAAIYGEAQEFPTPEDYHGTPISFYGEQKLVAEKYIKLYEDLSPLILRFGNVFGPRQKSHDEGGVVGIFAKKLSHQEKAIIYGDGQQRRDFIYVKDVARYILRGIEADLSGVFNCSSGKEISIIDLYTLMAKLQGKEAGFEFVPERKGELRRSILDVSKLKQTLPLKRMDIKTALKETMEYFEK